MTFKYKNGTDKTRKGKYYWNILMSRILISIHIVTDEALSHLKMNIVDKKGPTVCLELCKLYH